MDIQVLASGSTGNSYKISDGVTSVLIEAGIPFKQIQKALNFQVSTLDGVLLSHEHGDHSKSIKDLIASGINCYMLQATADALGVSGHRVKVIAPKKLFTLNSMEIIPFATEHDVPSVGYLIYSRVTKEKLVFITDTFYCKYLFKGLTRIMIECNYADDILQANIERGSINPALAKRLLRSHFSLANVKEFLRANDLSKVQSIHLMHLSDGNSDAERFKREVAQLTGKLVIIC